MDRVYSDFVCFHNLRHATMRSPCLFRVCVVNRLVNRLFIQNEWFMCNRIFLGLGLSLACKNSSTQRVGFVVSFFLCK